MGLPQQYGSIINWTDGVDDIVSVSDESGNNKNEISKKFYKKKKN